MLLYELLTETVSTPVQPENKHVSRMRQEEPRVYSQMCVNMLRYVTDLPGSVTQSILSSGLSEDSSRRTKDSGRTVQCTTSDRAADFSIVNLLAKYLENYTDKEGLFRIPGNSVRIEKLKDDLRSRNLIDFAKKRYTHNDVASALKFFIRQTPRAVIPAHLQQAHIHVAEMTYDLEIARCESRDKPEVEFDHAEEFCREKNRQIRALQILMALLPQESYTMLKTLTALLHSIAKNQDLNKMSANNLATIFTPHILWPLDKKVKNCNSNNGIPEIDMATMQKASYAVTFMIRHTHKIFVLPEQLCTNVSDYYKAQEFLNPNVLSEDTRTSASNANKSAARKTLFMANNAPVNTTHCSKRSSTRGRDSVAKRSRSLGAQIKRKLLLGSSKKTPATPCAVQQLVIESERSGLVCSSPAGIQSPRNLHLLV